MRHLKYLLVLTCSLGFSIGFAMDGNGNNMINERYVNEIKPIFKRACFDCHSDQTKYPWYYKIPGVKQLMDNHIEEAREHLDFSNDFPFQSKKQKPQLKLVHEIWEEIEEGEMPLWSYTIMHSEAKLAKDELQMIKDWVDYSQEVLKTENPNAQEANMEEDDHDH